MKGRKTEADCGPQSPGGPRAAAEAQVALQQAQAKLQNEVKEDASSNQYPDPTPNPCPNPNPNPNPNQVKEDASRLIFFEKLFFMLDTQASSK